MKKLLILFMVIVMILSSCRHTEQQQEPEAVLEPEVTSESTGDRPVVRSMSDTDFDTFFASAITREQEKKLEKERLEREAAEKEAAEKAERERLERERIEKERLERLEAERMESSETPSDPHPADTPTAQPEPEVPDKPQFLSVRVTLLPEEAPESPVWLAGEDVRTVTGPEQDISDTSDETSSGSVRIIPEKMYSVPEGEDGTDYLRTVRDKYADINGEQVADDSMPDKIRLLLFAVLSVTCIILICMLVKRVIYRRPGRKADKKKETEKPDDPMDGFIPATFTPGQGEQPVPENVFDDASEAPPVMESGDTPAMNPGVQDETGNSDGVPDDTGENDPFTGLL